MGTKLKQILLKKCRKIARKLVIFLDKKLNIGVNFKTFMPEKPPYIEYKHRNIERIYAMKMRKFGEYEDDITIIHNLCVQIACSEEFKRCIAVHQERTERGIEFFAYVDVLKK